ncbi:2-amino-4-hydroxy-6-hydroxymethyldihydropteridine diphosphokinase [uncultured Shimia sp.]|uniref:2-amino-4-hydroxy-6- hydroxymethyldihydropteridine diphosphokinase n=1 Tax=uncultured Shimia sp. TaxID=573152 RepID=UPI0025D7BF6B|nr:2-amino-4-hydroxy-6-hydroxymethyldihydropteridine diphosphokinase [uncultured Shimia sp.]
MSSFGLLALGGNLPSQFGSPIQTLQEALIHLNRNAVHIRAVSRFFQTPCFPIGAGPDFINAAATIETELSAQEVLTELHKIESAFGRERLTRWGTRPLDIDLIGYESQVLPNSSVWTHWRDLSAELQAQEAPADLILPHPRLQDRAFVLAPLMDVAPDWKHPVTGCSVAQMLEDLPEFAQKEPRPL